MFRPIRSLPLGTYFVAEHGVKGQLVECYDGFAKVDYLSREGKRKRTEWSPDTSVSSIAPFDLSAADAETKKEPKPERLLRPTVELSDKSEATTTPVAATQKVDNTKRTKVTLFGHSIRAVVRWMGSRQWTLERAMSVLATYGAVIDEGSVKYHLKNKQNKPSAELTDDNAQTLNQLAEKTPTAPPVPASISDKKTAPTPKKVAESKPAAPKQIATKSRQQSKQKPVKTLDAKKVAGSESTTKRQVGKASANAKPKQTKKLQRKKVAK